MSEINLGAIQSIFDRFDTRQRLFQADLARTTRKHSRKIRKETEVCDFFETKLSKIQQKNKKQKNTKKKKDTFCIPHKITPTTSNTQLPTRICQTTLSLQMRHQQPFQLHHP